MSASTSWSKRRTGVRIGFTQIAGLVARRILTFVREGDNCEAGERVGLIRFGSRVDVYLPAGTGPRVLLGPALDRRRNRDCGIGRRSPNWPAPASDQRAGERDRHGIPFRAMVPNAITVLALCFGLRASASRSARNGRGRWVRRVRRRPRRD